MVNASDMPDETNQVDLSRATPDHRQDKSAERPRSASADVNMQDDISRRIDDRVLQFVFMKAHNNASFHVIQSEMIPVERNFGLS